MTGVRAGTHGPPRLSGRDLLAEGRRSRV